MLKVTTVIRLRQPDAIDDPLTELAREGARRMLAQALIAEADAFVALWKDSKLPDGRDRVVRHGHGPHRAIQTGVGPVEVRRAKVRDRGEVGPEEKIRFTSSILPKWARRTKTLDALLPVLYLRGVSTGDFQEALAALLGKAAPNLSPAVISRLTAEWQADYDAWQNRDLSARRYVYVWADGVYLQARMEPAAECMLVVIGATPEGKKELVGFQTGVRESAQSWRELLIDIKQRGLEIAPDPAVGDGALGFWKAIEEVFPGARHQRCWVHKTANVLNKVALSVQINMKADLREIYVIQNRLLPVTKLPDGNGGLFKPNRMWSAVVDREGRLCSILNTGNDPWPGSRAIAIAKAETANDFSNSALALSTANLYGPTQPDGSLYGLNNSNPYNPVFDNPDKPA